jgi:hypothetical protein
VALGLFLWRSDLFVQRRDLVWRLPAPVARLTQVEIQLYGEDGRLVKREERFFPAGGAPEEIRQEIALKQGRYMGRVFLTGLDGGTRQRAVPIQIGGEAEYRIELE